MSSPLPSPEEVMKILRESGCSPRVIRHCKAVAKLALHVANKCVENGVNIDVQLVHIGALLHDIGRSKTHNVNHGVIGAEIARSLNLPASVVSIIERHIGGGISAEEASKLGWPNRSYMPETLEEKIVTYADKLIEGSKVVHIEETLQKLREKLSTDHPAVTRVASIHREISSLCRERRNE